MRMSLQIAERGRSLAKRRLDHMSELERSGRWSRFYSKDDFQIQFHKAKKDLEGWEKLVRDNPSSEEPGATN
jgi:uncharacterized repeat protein (TIGR03809 family)